MARPWRATRRHSRASTSSRREHQVELHDTGTWANDIGRQFVHVRPPLVKELVAETSSICPSGEILLVEPRESA